MEYLSHGCFHEAHLYLKNAEQILKNPNVLHFDDFCKLYSLTMNNLGCYYKKVAKPNVGLKYMKQALEKEEESK